jgi:hypothetical protein
MANDEDNHQLSYAASRKLAAERRSQQRAAGNVPSHGPFYYIDGVIKAQPETIEGSAQGATFIEPAVDDYKLWQQIARSHPKLRPAYQELQTYYTAFPRGLVVCSKSEAVFKVFISPEIPESVYPEIISIFGLQKHSEGLEFDTSDPKYVRSAEDIDVMEYLYDQYEITDMADRKATPRRGDEECKKLLTQALNKQKIEAGRRAAPARQAANARQAAAFKEERAKTKANPSSWGPQQ